MAESKALAFERLERVKFQRREFHPVGTNPSEMAECMEWVRSLGHNAETLCDDGFRYRSVYSTPCKYTGLTHSGWKWAAPGQWLMHMVGDGQDRELDEPHDEGPIDEDGELDWTLSQDEWLALTPEATS